VSRFHSTFCCFHLNPFQQSSNPAELPDPPTAGTCAAPNVLQVLPGKKSQREKQQESETKGGKRGDAFGKGMGKQKHMMRKDMQGSNHSNQGETSKRKKGNMFKKATLSESLAMPPLLQWRLF
jgi:hypothetical protein